MTSERTIGERFSTYVGERADVPAELDASTFASVKELVLGELGYPKKVTIASGGQELTVYTREAGNEFIRGSIGLPPDSLQVLLDRERERVESIVRGARVMILNSDGYGQLDQAYLDTTGALLYRRIFPTTEEELKTVRTDQQFHDRRDRGLAPVVIKAL